MARKAKSCQVCWNHKSSCSRWCDVCQHRVNPGCILEYCLAQDGHDAEPPGRRTLCKDCFISMSRAILPLASTLPEALAIVERNIPGHHRYGAQHAIARASGSFQRAGIRRCRLGGGLAGGSDMFIVSARIAATTHIHI